MKKILITGGPVHAHLDAVKIITNTFRGGMMSALADDLQSHPSVQVTYLTAKGFSKPTNAAVVYHDGFHDYFEKVLELAPDFDAVILGAAVSNLIPVNPWKGKFPSHDYKVGDVIPIDFTVAPRVITEVKKVAPKTHLFGFKLLADVDHDELVRAAYEVLLSSKATAVIANDRSDLQQKYIVTKERGVRSIDTNGGPDAARRRLSSEILSFMDDEYYQTKTIKGKVTYFEERQFFNQLIQKHHSEFIKVPEGYVFGTIAVRAGDGFITTGRGKHEVEESAFVQSVDHQNRIVYCVNDGYLYGDKSTLNAPLLSHIFNTTYAKAIIHFHYQDLTLPTLPYAPPGTVRDSIRTIPGSFNIAAHGCFKLIM